MPLPNRCAHGALRIGPLTIGILVLFLIGGSMPARGADNGDPDPRTGQRDHRLPAHLYFADAGGRFLTAEQRVLPHPGTPGGFGRNIIQGLIDGPDRTLMRTMPEATVLRALYVSDDGTAWVDLTRNLQTDHCGGVQMERLTIFAIVNSLVLNVPEIQAVKILIDGNESQTLAGHMDLRFPFKAEMRLIR